MAIDPVQKVWLVSPAAEAQDVPGKLSGIGLLHVSEVAIDDAKVGENLGVGPLIGVHRLEVK